MNRNLLVWEIKVFGENGLIALGRDCYHRVHLSSTNLLTSEKRNQLKSEWFWSIEYWTIDCHWHEIKPENVFLNWNISLFTIRLFCFSGVSFYLTEVSLNSSENVRGNYLSNDDIYYHMNLQLTFGGQGDLTL